MGRTTNGGQTPKVPWLVDGEKLGSIGRDALRSEAFGWNGEGNRIATRHGYLRHPHGGLGSQAEVKAQPVGRHQSFRFTVVRELDVVRDPRHRLWASPVVN